MAAAAALAPPARRLAPCALLALLLLAAGEALPRCLDAGHKAVLVEPPALPVLIEVNDWHTHHLVSAVAEIIISEHLGYEVRMNPAANTTRIYERVAIASGSGETLVENDGRALKDIVAEGSPFFYVNMEVWNSETALRELAYKYIGEDKTVLSWGDPGYDGREGWYLPTWVAEACNAIAYPAIKPNSDSVIRTAAKNHGMLLDCPAAGYHDNLMGGYGAWCPRGGKMLALASGDDWAQAVQKEIILNNGFNIALVLIANADLEGWVENKLDLPQSVAACGESGFVRPFMSYWWEPTLLATNPALERMLLPTRSCGKIGPPGTDNGTWRCDFLLNHLAKMGSSDVPVSAPLLDSFMNKFTLTSDELTDLLRDLKSGTDVANISAERYHQIACDWVRANEAVWSTWALSRADLPFWAEVWSPLTFFMVFFVVMLVFLTICFLSESLFIAGQEIRQEKFFGWPSQLEVGLPLGLWLSRLSGCCKASSTKVANAQESKDQRSCGLLWASSTFYGTVRSGEVKLCLLRFGDAEQLEKGLTVCIETQDVTMKPGAKGKVLGYQSLDNAEVVFEPGHCIAWTSVKLAANGFWAPELRFRVVVQGRAQFRGSRSCTCVVWDDDRRWPSRTLRAPCNYNVFQNVRYAKDVVLMVSKMHGWQQERLRLMYCVVDAVWDTIGANFVYNVYVLTYVIGQSYHEGLIYVTLIYAVVIAFKRCKEWRYAVAGTVGLRLVHKNLVTWKAFDSGMSSDDPQASASRIFSLHTKVIDESLPVLYTAVYNLMDDIISVAVAPAYILATASSSVGTGRLTIYLLVPMAVMVLLSVYAAVLRYPKQRNQILKEMAETHETYMDRLDEATELRPLIDAHGPESPLDGAGWLHAKGTMVFTSAWVRYIFYKMDVVFLLGALCNAVYTAAMVTLVLLHVESKDFGVCAYSLSQFLTSMSLFSRVQSSLKSMGKNLQTLFEGYHWVVDLDNYLNNHAASEQRALEKEDKFSALPSARHSDFMKQMSQSLNIEYTGVPIPLGRVYRVEGSFQATMDFCATLSGCIENCKPDIPSFVRVLHLNPNLPTFEDDAGEAATLLAFAEPGRFAPEFAEKMITTLMGEDDPGNLPRTTLPSLGAPRRWTTKSSRRSTTTSKTRHETQLWSETAIMLGQGFLADPDVLILDRIFEKLPHEAVDKMTAAALAWQSGGPEAVLGQAAPGGCLPAGAPAWLCREGGVHRTLIFRSSQQGGQTLSQIAKQAPWRIDVDGPVVQILDPEAAADQAESGDEKSSSPVGASAGRQEGLGEEWKPEAVVLPGVPDEQ